MTDKEQAAAVVEGLGGLRVGDRVRIVADHGTGIEGWLVRPINAYGRHPWMVCLAGCTFAYFED
jgi:hypothetical protein